MVVSGGESGLANLRRELHAALSSTVLGVRGDRQIRGATVPVFSNADKHSDVSVDLAARVAAALPESTAQAAAGTASGSAFERAVEGFVAGGMEALADQSPWTLHVAPGEVISHYAQYAHLDEVQEAVRRNPELEATIGGDYLVRPDLVVTREPLADADLNAESDIVGPESVADLSPVRRHQDRPNLPLLHASISCKWTIRSDRVQNTRTEALNLVRNRKGRTPHIVAVTMEPLPNRVAAIAIGTGDIDCVYHVALHELREAADAASEEHGGGWSTAAARLRTMVRSSRLRDISDLPLDLLV